jgi:hypothetical protein
MEIGFFCLPGFSDIDYEIIGWEVLLGVMLNE